MARTVWEILGSEKSVFITLTFKRKRKLTNVYADFQRYAKRVRINLERRIGKTCRLRFVCATECGDRGGRLHLHAIMCVHGGSPSVHFFRNRWQGGITHARAIKADSPRRVARYVAKYLAKSGRIRASSGFGTSSGTIERVNQNVRRDPTGAAIFDAFPGAQVFAVRSQAETRPVNAPYGLRRAFLVARDARRGQLGRDATRLESHVWVWDHVAGEYQPAPHLDPSDSVKAEH